MDAAALHERITKAVLRQIQDTDYPSITMMNRVEAALRTPDDLARYVEILVKKVESTQYPSIDMLNRLDRLSAQLA